MKTLKKRKLKYLTDYGKRLKLLKSGKPRLVFRRTNKYVIAQYVLSKQAKDSIEFGITSKELLKYGWPEEFKNSLKSIPASYFTGMLMAKKIISEKKQMPIVDFGMSKTFYKTGVFAFLKGLIEGGIEIDCKQEAFPDEEKIKGKNLKQDFSPNFEKIKQNILGK